VNSRAVDGCATAATAADSGLRVLIVEKTDLVGGQTTNGEGSMWLPGNHQAQELGIVDTVDEGIAYIQSLAANGQVMNTRQDPIPGLYAVGNAAGRNDLGFLLQSGLQNMRGLTYGHLVGKCLAGHRVGE
jgi:succinate dehydrogenase/fumarate reductase flavoprotein subunit